MYGRVRFDKWACGWLNPYHLKLPDGNTEFEHLTVLSQTSINELIKDVDAEWAEAIDVG